MERIEAKWNAYGYNMPNLIFWNVDARHDNLRLAPNVWIENYYIEQDTKPEELFYGCLCKVKDNLYIRDENDKPRKVVNAFYQDQKIKVIWKEENNNAKPFFTFSDTD